MEYYSKVEELADGATITLKPALTEIWLLQNVFYGGTISLVRTNGTESVTFATTIETGCTLNLNIILTCYDYAEIVSEDSSTINVAYDYNKL